MNRTLPLYATLLLCAAPAAAEPAGALNFTGFNSPALRAYLGPALQGAAVGDAPAQDDAVIGVYRSGRSFWRWRQGQADLASKNIRELVGGQEEGRVHRLDAPLAAAGSWVVLENEGASIYVGVDAAGERRAMPLHAAWPIKDADDQVRQLPVTLRRRGENFYAEYGSPAAGALVLTRPQPRTDAASGETELAQQPLFTAFYKGGAGAPQFSGAYVEGDISGLHELMAVDSLKGLDAVKNLLASDKHVAMIEKEIAAGGHLYVDLVEGRELDVTVYRQGEDAGKLLFYTFDGEIYTE